MITASPVLGNLNSGLQLYRLKYKQPEKIQIHSYLITPAAVFKLFNNGTGVQ